MEKNKKGVKKYVKILIFFAFVSIMVCYFSMDVFNKRINLIDPDLVYILQWTSPDTEPFIFMGKGQETFFKKHCPVNNCFITSDRFYLEKLTDFNAILFHGPETSRQYLTLPGARLPHQLYVFASMESSHYYPITDRRYNRFFNWTWTYKLNSDLYYGYMIIKNKDGDIIGPKRNMRWLNVKKMEPISLALKKELSHKKLAAAWFVSNCKTLSKREDYVNKIRMELARYNMTVDTYGKCGDKQCPRENAYNCRSQLRKLYYFYFSFENSFSEDYVTEKLLTGLLNNAVPVVYGGANYSRFVPDGAYLNARKLGVRALVRQMVDAIRNPKKYYDFFKWKNHYSYHYVEDSPETNYYCQLCDKINANLEDISDKKITVTQKVYANFRKWWNV